MEMSSLFDDDYNDHEIAWLGKDWKMVQELADSYKEKPENEFFNILNSINDSKQQLNVSQMDYSKMMIENALSQHPECMPSVYAMNLIGSNLSNQSHFNYLKCAIPKGKRYGKWAKLSQSALDELVLKAIMTYYSINLNDAMMYRDILVSKNKLNESLKKMKALVNDDMIKSVTKNVKEQKDLKKKIMEW